MNDNCASQIDFGARQAGRATPIRRRMGWGGALTAAAALLLGACPGHAAIVGTSASVRSNNSLIVDVSVTTDSKAAKLFVTYQAPGVAPLVSPPTRASGPGVTTITIGRLRAATTYSYTVSAVGEQGGQTQPASGSFTTGSLPAPLLLDTFHLTGRSSAPLVILPINQVTASGTFLGYVALDLHAADAPQIVWYYVNTPSTASGVLQVDTVSGINQERNGNFLYTDGGSGGPTAADAFYREITPDGTLLRESPNNGSVTPPPPGSPPAPGWIWGQGNNAHEALLPGMDGIPGTVLHLGHVVKDPFFDAGLAAKGTRLQMGTTIRRWDARTQTDEVVWDPFDFLNPLTERTTAGNSDPGSNSNSQAVTRAHGASLHVEEWMHANSLQVAPNGEVLMSVRHLDTVLAISPEFDRIDWRIGRIGSDFSFPTPGDEFYHEHFVRMMENGHLLMFDNGNGRPLAEGGQYSRALELALDWNTMTATKVWEYRHQVGSSGGAPVYKYSDKVGSVQRLENGNSLVLYGSDIDPTTLKTKTPQTFTLVEADANPEAGPVAVLDMHIPNNFVIYRALPVDALFGER